MTTETLITNDVPPPSSDEILERIAELNGFVRDAMDQIPVKVEAEVRRQLLAERTERKDAISRLQNELGEFERNTGSRLVSIESALEKNENMLNRVNGSVERLTGVIEGWNKALQIRDRNIEAVTITLSQQADDISKIQSSASLHDERIRQTRRDIFGDGDSPDAPSLHKSLTQMSIDTNRQISGLRDLFAKNHADLVARVDSNSIVVQALKAADDARREQWQKRRTMAWQTFVFVIKNRWAWILLLGVVGAMFAGVVDKLPSLIELMIE